MDREISTAGLFQSIDEDDGDPFYEVRVFEQEEGSLLEIADFHSQANAERFAAIKREEGLVSMVLQVGPA
jgi:hypothetical protein